MLGIPHAAAILLGSHSSGVETGSASEKSHSPLVAKGHNKSAYDND